MAGSALSVVQVDNLAWGLRDWGNPVVHAIIDARQPFEAYPQYILYGMLQQRQAPRQHQSLCGLRLSSPKQRWVVLAGAHPDRVSYRHCRTCLRHYAALSGVSRTPPVDAPIFYKAVLQNPFDHTLRSLFTSKVVYRFGEPRHDPVRPFHNGGLYAMATRDAALACGSELYRDWHTVGKYGDERLVVISVKAWGRYVVYACTGMCCPMTAADLGRQSDLVRTGVPTVRSTHDKYAFDYLLPVDIAWPLREKESGS